MRKILFFITFALLFYFFGTTGAQASIITVDKTGKITVKVLAESSELAIKDIKVDGSEGAGSAISLSKENGKFALNVVSSEGEKTLDVTELGGDLIEIEERPEVKRVNIGLSHGMFTIQQEDIVATTNFPISINPETAKIALLTPSGQKFLSILPRDAFESGLRAKSISKLQEGTNLALVEAGGKELLYQIEGEKTINVFNLLSVDVPVRASISAFSGEVVSLEQPVWLKVLGFMFS